MRRPKYFLGDLERGGELSEGDFRRGLSIVTDPGVLPEAQQYDALQALTHWGLEGERPDLALDAYNAYVVHGWSWQARTIEAQRAEVEKLQDEYFRARNEKEDETGERHDGMPFFSMFNLDYHGAIEGRVQGEEKEGEAFRNDVLPRILMGMLERGQLQKVHEFLMDRRAIHNFRGQPRELEAEQTVDVHVGTAQSLLDLASEAVFEGNREVAFADLATFALVHAQFPQFGAFQVVPRLAPIRKAMVERGLDDPWEIFISRLDYAMRDFTEKSGAEFTFNGIRRYLAAAQSGEVEDLRTLRDWPEHALQAFDMVERSPSIPSGLAWLIPAAETGNTCRSASDNFQSFPVLGQQMLAAAAGDAEAAAEVMRLSKEPMNVLGSGTPALADALRLVTNSR
jgi:hypothetical protein